VGDVVGPLVCIKNLRDNLRGHSRDNTDGSRIGGGEDSKQMGWATAAKAVMTNHKLHNHNNINNDNDSTTNSFAATPLPPPKFNGHRCQGSHDKLITPQQQ
jgi:hypothetical protein